MKTIALSTRLFQVAQYIPSHTRVADIGTDHAYLPIYLIQQQQVIDVIGSEIADGPYQNACDNIQKYDLQSHIHMRFGAGLETLRLADDIQTISINGMGGQTIVNILAAGIENRSLTVPTLVLQPNTDEWYVRYWLEYHHYRITAEAIVSDNNECYEVIQAVYDEMYQPQLSRLDILFGKYLRQQRDALFVSKHQQALQHEAQLLQHIPKDSARYRYILQHYTERKQIL